VEGGAAEAVAARTSRVDRGPASGRVTGLHQVAFPRTWRAERALVLRRVRGCAALARASMCVRCATLLVSRPPVGGRGGPRSSTLIGTASGARGVSPAGRATRNRAAKGLSFPFRRAETVHSNDAALLATGQLRRGPGENLDDICRQNRWRSVVVTEHESGNRTHSNYLVFLQLPLSIVLLPHAYVMGHAPRRPWRPNDLHARGHLGATRPLTARLLLGVLRFGNPAATLAGFQPGRVSGVPRVTSRMSGVL